MPVKTAVDPTAEIQVPSVKTSESERAVLTNMAATIDRSWAS